jgi:Aldo/keto reductase family
VWSAASRVAQCPADLGHAPGREPGHRTPKGRTRHGVDVAEVHHAVTRQSVLRRGEQQVGDQSASGPGQRRHDDRADSVSDRIAREQLADKVKAIADEKGCTAAQLALAWVLAQGEDLVPIPGTKRRTYLEQNVGALDVQLTADELARIDAELPAAAGDRYPEAGMRGVNI